MREQRAGGMKRKQRERDRQIDRQTEKSDIEKVIKRHKNKRRETETKMTRLILVLYRSQGFIALCVF